MKKQNRGEESRLLKNGAEALDLSTLPRCQGISETTGEPCKRAAVKGEQYCGIHSGRYKPGAPLKNKNAATQCLDVWELKTNLIETRLLIKILYDSIDRAVGKTSTPKPSKEAI